METLFQDIRYGYRMLLKRPGFTAIAVIALALGIGANTAIFSVINAVLLRPLSYKDPSQLVMVWEKNIPRNRERNTVAPANYLDWIRQNDVFSSIGAVYDYRLNLTGEGEPEELQAQLVTASFFPTLGVQPFLGRMFAEDEDREGNAQVTILSYRLWQRRFNSNPDIINSNITLHGETRTVVGVMPPGFHFLNKETEIWVPIVLDPAQDYRKTSGRFLRSVARLAPGVTREQAQAQMAAIASQLEQTYPSFNTGWSVNLIPIHEQVVGDIRLILLLLLGAVAFVLLIACANVANLLLARAATRQKELALRTALGAGRGRIVRQLLTESVLLAGLGGVVGLVLAYWAIKVIVAAAPDDIPRLGEVGIDGRVLGFTMLASFMTGIIFGLVPALQASKPDLNETLKEGGRGASSGTASHVRNLFVVSEIALCLVLLVGAGLMIRSFIRLQDVNPGFRPESLLTMKVSLPGSKYREAQQRISFFQQLQERVQNLPGVETVGAINFLPLTGPAAATSFTIEGRPTPADGEKPGTDVRIVTPGYFEAMGIPLLKGRLLTERDTATSSRVLVINETMARQFFPDEDPIGKRIVVDWRNTGPDEIVGVVGDIKDKALDADLLPTVFWPHARDPYPFMTLIVRAGADPLSLAASAQNEVRTLDPNQPVAEIRAMQEVLSGSISGPRFNTLLLALFAGVALILAAVGIYGVIGYSVAQRTHEIGIRMALGAQGADILKLVVGQALLLTTIGLATGLVASLVLTSVMRSLLFGVSATDPVTFAVVSSTLAAVALLASYLPARRALKVDPMVALRYE